MSPPSVPRRCGYRTPACACRQAARIQHAARRSGDVHLQAVNGLLAERLYDPGGLWHAARPLWANALGGEGTGEAFKIMRQPCIGYLLGCW